MDTETEQRKGKKEREKGGEKVYMGSQIRVEERKKSQGYTR